MRRKSLDNKGSTLIVVMVAMSIVAMLAVVALWISLINFQMKTTDAEVKDNFYSAESVLDQICTGLQVNVSKAFSTAYLDVMQNYSMLDEAGRIDRFNNQYVTSLRNQLKANDSDMNYDINMLISYVDSALTASGASPSAKIDCTSATDANMRFGLLNTYETGLVLKGIKVTFTDSKGFVSIIETDISLAIPDLNLTTSQDLPEIFSYSIIATAGSGISGDSTSRVDLSGNVYAGSPYVVDNTKTTEVTSFTIPNGKRLDVSNSEYFIAQGNVDIDTSGRLNTPFGCQLWTENINVNSASIDLLGNTYVADDLTLNGSGSNVTLGSNNSGKYVGYGNSKTEASSSSAIIINGKESTLDITGLKEMLISGYAYINTGAIAGTEGFNNKNIQTGDSISVKGNQIAYLLPAECLYTEGEGPDAKSKFSRNPLSYGEYNKVHDDSKYTEVNAEVITSKTGKSLSSYITQGTNINDVVSTVFVPSADGKTDSGYVYYYINLDANMAEEYYHDFYNADAEKLNLYTDFYTNYIKANEDASASIFTVGNYSLYNEKNLSLMRGIVDDIDVDAQASVLSKTYTALSKKLIRNYEALTTAELSNTIFQNLINESNIVSVTSGEAGLLKKFTSTNTDGSTVEAVVVNGDYIYDASNPNIRLIVSTGDVIITGDFTGTIIAKGRIDIKANCRIQTAPEDVFKRLLAVPANAADADSLMLYNVFVQGSEYLTNSIVGENATVAEDSRISYSDVITYQNWTKE